MQRVLLFTIMLNCYVSSSENHIAISESEEVLQHITNHPERNYKTQARETSPLFSGNSFSEIKGPNQDAIDKIYWAGENYLKDDEDEECYIDDELICIVMKHKLNEAFKLFVRLHNKEIALKDEKIRKLEESILQSKKNNLQVNEDDGTAIEINKPKAKSWRRFPWKAFKNMDAVGWKGKGKQAFCALILLSLMITVCGFGFYSMASHVRSFFS